MIDAQPPTIFDHIRSIAEFLYFLAGIAIAGFSWRALSQVALLKKDIRLRNERVAKEKAIEACQRYSQILVPLANAEYQERSSKKTPEYSGPYDSFDIRSWPRPRIDGMLVRIRANNKWGPVINELEIIAATCGASFA